MVRALFSTKLSFLIEAKKTSIALRTRTRTGVKGVKLAALKELYVNIFYRSVYKRKKKSLSFPTIVVSGIYWLNG